MARSCDLSTPNRTEANAHRLGPLTLRLVYAMVLFAIIPTTANCIGLVLSQSSAVDETRLATATFAVMSTIGTILIWRSLVVWTLGRAGLTAIIALIPFMQVIYPFPLWKTGCGNEFVLRHGQQFLTSGLWVWLTTWVWWGWERLANGERPRAANRGGTTMTLTGRRILMALGSVPVLFGLFMFGVVALEDFASLSGFEGLIATLALDAAVAVVIWMMIWRGEVAWTRTVISTTLISAFVLMETPLLLCVLYGGRSDPIDLYLAAATVAGWGLWMGGTARLWPMISPRASSSDVTPRCMRCGYMLNGLCATRCPECGDEPTLDELWRATVGGEV